MRKSGGRRLITYIYTTTEWYGWWGNGKEEVSRQLGNTHHFNNILLASGNHLFLNEI